MFFKSATNHLLKHFQEKLVVAKFVEKAMLEKGPKTTKEHTMITVLGVFKFDAILSCLFGICKKRGVGGEAPPPQKMSEEE